MHKLVHKVAPLGAMSVCVIWCCWSQLREGTPLFAAAEEKLPRIERKLLNPELSPASERDPFLQNKPAPPPVTEKAAVAIKAEKEEPPFDPQTVLPSIRLDATILGRRPLAVINGAIHNQGENITLEAAPEVRCQLQRVLADSIVMKIEEQSFVIGYSSTSKEVADPAAEPEPAPADEDASAVELPEGIPSPDQLDGAVADSLAGQPPSAERQPELDSQATDERAAEPDHADCEFERELLINNKLEELLNNHED